MDGEKLIQVSFQIPPSALDSLSRLAEQLRMLTETVAAQAAPVSQAAGSERGESDSFDPARFQALREGADVQPQAVSADVSDAGNARRVSTEISQIRDAEAVSAAISQVRDAEPVSATVSQVKDAATFSSEISQAGDAEPVSADVRKPLEDARSAGDTLYHPSEAPAAADAANAPQDSLLEERDTPLPPAEMPQASRLDKIPAARAEAETLVPDAPEARRDAVQQVPNVESARADAGERELALAAVRGEVSGGVETPLGAGMVVQTQPEMPQNRWSGLTEELVVPGPAPLTAEAVSLAFERDGRRYDNGFPLY